MKQIETEFMENYLYDLPYFLFFVVLGIVVNFLNASRDQELTKKRLAREFVGGIWISLIIFAILDEFFNLSRLFIYIICSLAGFGNSRLLDFLQKDFFEFLILQGKEATKNLVGRLKRSKNEGHDYYSPPSPYRMGEDLGVDETKKEADNRKDYENR